MTAIYKIIFFWPYRFCQWIARILFLWNLNLRWVLGGVLAAMILTFVIFMLNCRGGWPFSYLLRCSFLEWFWFYLYLACLFLHEKHLTLSKAIKKLNMNSPVDLIGIDLVTNDALYAKNFVQNDDWKVMGSEEPLRNLIQAFIERDAQKERSILILAPEGEDGLLEEITFILRERRKEEYRPFFYYSLNQPQLSASYSPFLGNNGPQLISLWIESKRPDEFNLMESLLNGIKESNKPFELKDLLLLLRDKNAVYALSDSRGMQDYLKKFHACPDARRKLAEKLEEFGKQLKLTHHPIHKGYPLNIPDLISSKHLYVEFSQKPSYLTAALFFDLLLEMEKRFNDYFSSAGRPFIYLIHPEKLPKYYLTPEIVKRLVKVSSLRIFSREYFPYENESMSVIVAPGASFGEKANEFKKSKFQMIDDEGKRRAKNLNLISIINEETFEATECLTEKMDIKRTYCFFHYWERENGHQWQCYLLFVPAKIRPKLNYEPYQKRYKPEDMLNLESLTKGKKRKNYDPGVIDIVKGFKPLSGRKEQQG